jgi:hypothetical protein
MGLRIVGVLGTLFVLTLAGCAYPSARPPVRESRSAASPSAAATLTLSGGDRCTLRCGITIVVPQRWSGRHYRPGKLGFSTLAGGYTVDGLSVRAPLDELPSSGIFEAFSMLATVAPSPPQLGAGARPSLVSTSLAVYAGEAIGGASHDRTWIVVTHLPGRPFGVLLYFGPKDDPRGSLLRMASTMQLSGVSLPVTP